MAIAVAHNRLPSSGMRLFSIARSPPSHPGRSGSGRQAKDVALLDGNASIHMGLTDTQGRMQRDMVGRTAIMKADRDWETAIRRAGTIDGVTGFR